MLPIITRNDSYLNVYFYTCYFSVLDFLCNFNFFVLSVKYEDPLALGGLASALDVRQQNATGVSTWRLINMLPW